MKRKISCDKSYCPVIKAIAQGKKTKKRACVELNLSERQINRLLLVYQQKGKEAFRHGNRNRKPKHAIPDEIKERIPKEIPLL